MATEFNRETLALEMERLQTSIKYHDWFLGFVVVVGISLSIYLVDSMNTLQEGLHEVRAHIMVMQKDIKRIQEDVDSMKTVIDSMQSDINRLDRKVDRYHSDTGT